MKKTFLSALSVIPLLKQLRRRLLAYRCYLADIRRHLRYSLYYRTAPDSRDSLRCAIMLLNHQLEKAQTYKSVKEGFGHEKLLQVLSYTDEYIRKYGADDLTEVTIGILSGHFANVHAWKDEATHAHFLKLKEAVSGRRAYSIGAVTCIPQLSPHRGETRAIPGRCRRTVPPAV